MQLAITLAAVAVLFAVVVARATVVSYEDNTFNADTIITLNGSTSLELRGCTIAPSVTVTIAGHVACCNLFVLYLAITGFNIVYKLLEICKWNPDFQIKR